MGKRVHLSRGTDMQEHGQLVQAVRAACDVAGLQPVPALVTKCLQLQDTMAVRFGVMLVGPAGETPNLPSSMSVHHVGGHALHHSIQVVLSLAAASLVVCTEISYSCDQFVIAKVAGMMCLCVSLQ